MSRQKETFIPKAKTTKLRKAPKSIVEVEEVPKDLQDTWAAIIAIATTHKMLQEGHFTYAHRNAVGAGIAFLEELHISTFAQAQKHPKAYLIAEIKTIAEKMNDNGKTTEN